MLVNMFINLNAQWIDHLNERQRFDGELQTLVKRELEHQPLQHGRGKGVLRTQEEWFLLRVQIRECVLAFSNDHCTCRNRNHFQISLKGKEIQKIG